MPDPIVDPYRYSSSTAAGPANRVFAVTPDDANDLPYVTTGIYVGSGGDLVVFARQSEQSVVLKGVAAGTILPIRATRVLASGTTATDIVGLA